MERNNIVSLAEYKNSRPISQVIKGIVCAAVNDRIDEVSVVILLRSAEQIEQSILEAIRFRLRDKNFEVTVALDHSCTAPFVYGYGTVVCTNWGYTHTGKSFFNQELSYLDLLSPSGACLKTTTLFTPKRRTLP